MRIGKTLNIDIQRRDIARGARKDGTCCPIALALSRRLGGVAVNVQPEVIETEDGVRFYASRDIELFIAEFDQGFPVKPSRFTLERIP